ncbi:MAG: hypothetical protein JWO75_1053 [Actinomycetia bacterium]|jgi:hypothetical protein|nr:hypothetical protein [Actinomycetes bacterium]
MTSPDAAPEPTAGAAAPVAPAAAAGGASAREPVLPVLPVLPVQSSEDTDTAWGEYPQRDDDRLNRDRPPHWDDF